MGRPRVWYCRRTQCLRRASEAFGCKTLCRQLRTGARFWDEFWDPKVVPRVSCGPPWGSPECDTVIEFSVYDVLAKRLVARLYADSSERERDSGANLGDPKVIPRGTADLHGEPDVRYRRRIQRLRRGSGAHGDKCRGRQLRAGARFWRESWGPQGHGGA